MIIDKHVVEFEKLGMGIFVHWGLYSQQGRGEWTYLLHEQKMDEYEKLINTFTAEDFNAEELALLAKENGFRYITLTTRHHEGFSLYDTKGLSDFDVMHSPAKRDLVREFVDACRKYDILPVFYHTTLDWHHPDFENNFDSYLEYLRKSVEILCTEYGPIGGLWFDGNWSKPAGTDWKETELYETIRKNQPNAMIINNTGLGARGETGHPMIDAVTFERGTPTPMNREGMPKYLAAEMCDTINDHWGYSDHDIAYASPRNLIYNLCDSRKVGANYLLNIGPTAQGGIAPIQKELIRQVGIWANLYKEAIYEVQPYSQKCAGNKNYILKGKDALYIFCYAPGLHGDMNVSLSDGYSGPFAFGDVKDEIESIHWLDDNTPVDFMQKDDMLCVRLKGFDYGYSYCVRVAKAILKK